MLTEHADLPIKRMDEEKVAIDRIQHWFSLERIDQWLVIFDNYDDPYLPGIRFAQERLLRRLLIHMTTKIASPAAAIRSIAGTNLPSPPEPEALAVPEAPWVADARASVVVTSAGVVIVGIAALSELPRVVW